MFHWIWIYPLKAEHDLVVTDTQLKHIRLEYGSAVHILESNKSKNFLIKKRNRMVGINRRV